MMHLVFIVFALFIERTEACCKAAKPDPTFVDSDEYYLDDVYPDRGTKGGETRLTLKGGGFNVNFFTGGNYVYIGRDDEEWVPCDVIEGACSVECGGPHTLVCDTRAWTFNEENFRSGSGWLDVKVEIEIFADAGKIFDLLEKSKFLFSPHCPRFIAVAFRCWRNLLAHQKQCLLLLRAYLFTFTDAS